MITPSLYLWQVYKSILLIFYLFYNPQVKSSVNKTNKQTKNEIKQQQQSKQSKTTTKQNYNKKYPLW